MKSLRINGLLGAREHQKTKRVVFWAIFIGVFLLSGVLSIATNFNYRMGLLSALVLPLILLYGVQIDFVLIAYMALSAVIGISALINHSSFGDFVLFMRIPGFSYLMYYLVNLVMEKDIARPIIRAGLALSLIQLPIVILQNYLYPFLPERWTYPSIHVDFGFGTFNYKTDYAMAFFIAMLIVLFLFERKDSLSHWKDVMIIGWLSLTVFSVNAQIVKIFLLLAYAIYIITHLNWKTIGRIALVFTAIFVALIVMTRAGALSESPIKFVERAQAIEYLHLDAPPIEAPSPEDSDDVDVAVSDDLPPGYLSGDYDRLGALQYFVSNPINWFGDGPSRYYDVFTRTFTRGNVGHFFTFYSEVGALGWLLSVAIYFLIAMVNQRTGKLQLHWAGVLGFVSINVLSLTSHVMNDIAVGLAYCIFTSPVIIDYVKKELVKKEKESLFGTILTSG